MLMQTFLRRGFVAVVLYSGGTRSSLPCVTSGDKIRQHACAQLPSSLGLMQDRWSMDVSVDLFIRGQPHSIACGRAHNVNHFAALANIVICSLLMWSMLDRCRSSHDGL